MVTMKRAIFVHPFHEEDVLGLVELVGAGNVVFGSDYPHPEGMFDPVTFVDELEPLAEAVQKAVMGANLARLMHVDPVAKAI
jgi:predicted TIM-barrel fold metal-dependent hydrolase